MGKILSLISVPILITFLSWVLGQFTYELPDGITSVFTAIYGFLSQLSFILPIETIGTILGYTVIFQTVVWSALGGYWLWNFISSKF